MQWRGGSAGRVDLEELVLIIGVPCIDLDRENRVRSCELDTFPSGTVLNQMCHVSDARLAR